MRTRTLAAVALATVLATPAFAQTAKPDTMNKPNMPAATSTQSSMPSSSATGSFVTSQNATDWRGSKLIGASVYGPDNASIGEINDVLIGNDGKLSAVVIGVGGFLGVGEKDIALPFEAMNVTRKAGSDAIDKITVTYTKDQLNDAPKFAYLGTSPATTTGSNTSMPRATTPAAPMNDTTKK